MDSNNSVDPEAEKRRKKKGKKKKLVKVKQYYEQDIKMADAYGGIAAPRVRMVPKRFASVARDRANEAGIVS